MIKVSIIIPVYNVEQYLDKCLDSCVRQSLSEVEVIIINDASPDCSDVIMHKYAEMYPDKIRNVFLEKNIRQGGARNIGIQMAQGEYLCFVDGDDYIAETMCEKLYFLCKRENLDLACCDGYFVYASKIVYREKAKKYDMEGHSGVHHFTGQCYMMIRKDVIIENKLFYPEKILHEDTAVVPLWYLCAERMKLLSEPLYFQNIHANSVSSSIDVKSALQIIRVLHYLINYAKKLDIYEDNKDKIDAFILMRIHGAAKHLLRLKDKVDIDEKRQCVEELSRWSSYKWNPTLAYNLLTANEYFFVMQFLNNTDVFWKQEWPEYQRKIEENGFDEKAEKLQVLITHLKKCNKEIVIWGAGQKGKLVISTLHKMNEKYVVGDNDASLVGKELKTNDIVRELKWVCQNVPNAVFLVTATRYYRDIVNELMEKVSNPVTVDLMAYFEYNLSIKDVVDYNTNE